MTGQVKPGLQVIQFNQSEDPVLIRKKHETWTDSKGLREQVLGAYIVDQRAGFVSIQS